MGCDIHAFLEIKENNNWKFIKKLNLCRSYWMFSIFADVRNDDPILVPISEPKFLPQNVTKEVYEISEQWDFDGHSHSWLTISEIDNFDWNQSLIDSTGLVCIPKEFIPDDYLQLFEDMRNMEKTYGKDNVRIVFFFDN